MKKINNKTEILGVVGFPVSHSKSPDFFNTIFTRYNINALYHFIESNDIKQVLNAVRVFHYKGVSITIPHKIDSMKYIDEVDELAEKMKCINTVINNNGILKGYNFDGIGCLNALEYRDNNYFEKNILVVGTGGASRGISMSFILKKKIKKLYFLTRNKKDNFLYKEVQKYIDVEIYEYSEIDKLFDNRIEIIINTTPIGMGESLNKTPIDMKYLKDQIVFDIVYTPKETRLLREAKLKKCDIIYGYEMFLGQALEQLKLWYDLDLDKNEAQSLFQELS